MRATLMYGAGDVRVEEVPDATIKEPTDAVVRIMHAGICGSDLWPYRSLEPSDHGRRMGHEFIGIVEDVGSTVEGVRSDDLVISPFLWQDNTCEFCREGCRAPAPTAANTATTSTAAKAKPSASPKPPAR